jgi:uncharacterized protein
MPCCEPVPPPLTIVPGTYPPHWPVTPFHAGELQLQDRFGVREMVNSYAPKVVRPFFPQQHREFFTSLPFLVVAARDDECRMWLTLLTGPDGTADFITSPTSTTLSINGRPARGDALEHSISKGKDLGILGIEFATKRRNRVNGRIIASSDDDTSFTFQVDQSFGNCPQYIRPRQWWTSTAAANEHSAENDQLAKHQLELTESQMETIRQSDTMFIASGYREQGEDVRFGNDASHRGGVAGWISVRDGKTIFIPDYSGNNHYNTMGNLILDNRVGVTIPQFETGGMLQMTGTAKLHLDEQSALVKMYPGALHVIEFNIERVVELPAGSLPVRWTQESLAQSERLLTVTRKVKESSDVTSFHMKPTEVTTSAAVELWAYKPGQHLPITLTLGNNDKLMRTYSLSSGNDWGEYRISVKRAAFGQASRYLHDHVEVGDKIQVSQPAGDFFLDLKKEEKTIEDERSKKTLVLMSTGVGVTPILSMLHSFIQSVTDSNDNNRKAIWIHGARNGKHHPFEQEVSELAALVGEDSLKTHVVYSKPREQDDNGRYNSVGRIDSHLIQKLVPDLANAEFYMCGTASFMADINDALQKLGVPSKSIQYETF